MKSSPPSKASTGLCKCTLGKPGMAPSKTSSMLGCVAAVIETESPSQPRPAVIQRICTSFTAGAFCVDRPYGTAAVPIVGLLLSNQNAPHPRTYPFADSQRFDRGSIGLLPSGHKGSGPIFLVQGNP